MLGNSAPLASTNPPASYPAERRKRLSLLMTLYVSQAVPLGFFIEAVPAIGSSLGVSLQKIGLIQALALPYMIKFLWAPFIDGVGSSRHGHYRSWLIPLQVCSILLVLIVAGLSPAHHAPWMLGLGALFMLVAATQDIATDGLAVHTLAADERGNGNGVQVGGFYLGQILGGGFLLLVFSRFGLRWTFIAMAGLLAIPLLQLGSFKDTSRPHPKQKKIDMKAIGRFFRRPNSSWWVVILLLYRAGDAMAITMVKPMLVGYGYSLQQIGWIVGIGNSVSALSGALVGGVLVERLGRRLSLSLFGVLHALALASFCVPATQTGGLVAVWLTSAFTAFAGGMATSALYTAMMDRSNKETAGTDFTLQQSLAAVGPLLAASVSGVSAAAMGFSRHFLAAAALSLLCVLLIQLRWPGTTQTSTTD